ncbi:uncharacterized protein LOC118197886 isoform X2 [Stegodyphus dumicola]|uniref:uncharacterized protein LOC118197886 isoform X2 n=1 Tax=Stegodyphus dumicola TaxID=202533 RepID=UPI0015A95F0C|nr:uncharacterized protein LOC118197886 isoform X2 [Stegodyphus dumicola]
MSKMSCFSVKKCHETKISSWLPPVESWDSGGTGLPYGWEAAIDKEGKTYYVNHMNKTTTYENPRKDGDEEPPQPREVELVRDPQMGFGFVAGSEKPVIVRFVTEGGPNENKLMPGDQIMKINGEDVMRSPREHVIELIRSCKQTVTLLVCQPHTNNTTRKSALLTAAKKAKLKNNPSRVRFSEGVVINGSPLYSPSPMDSYVPFLPNVLKVFLENGQTKSFKYDSTTTVQDVLNSLNEKLSLKCPDHFSLATEHVKITRKNRLTVLDPKDTLAKIAARPGAHHLRCVFRVTFVPKDAYDLLQKDPVAFEYLYVQCCNDVVQERFAPELKYDIALRLAALHIQQHCLSSGMQGKITIKAVERECGLDRFVPVSLLDTMKRKELRKLLGHFLKQNQSLCAPGQKNLTALQAKLHYLKIISELPSYGSKCFSTNLRDSNPEVALLVSPRFGLSQIACLRNTSPVTLARIEELSDVKVTKEDEISSAVEIFMKDPDRQTLNFSMEDRDAEEFILLLKGYFRLLAGKELTVHWDFQSSWQAETVPCFHNRHTVREAPWSYPPHPNGPGLRMLDLAVPPPPYVPAESRQLPRNPSKEKLAVPSTPSPTSVDHNMNETLVASDQNHEEGNMTNIHLKDDVRRTIPHRSRIDECHPGIDYQSVISMELLEDSSGDIDVDIYEAKNDEVIKRISEMNQILVNVESYLSEKNMPSMQASEFDDEQSNLKATDSLLLLTQNQNDSDDNELEDKKEITVDEDVSPSESDTDSTPNDSPLHRSVPLRNSINSGHPMLRRDSSFGLHSPDLLPNISSGNNILDILKHMQSEEIQLPFAEGTLYLDPDIIDLTMIPPPITPDTESQDITGSPLDAPPTPFLDTGTLHKELEKWMSIPTQIAEEIEGEITPTNTPSASSSGKGLSLCSQENKRQENSTASVDLSHLHDAFNSLLLDSSAAENPGVDIKIDSIDSFIANLTVPPPPGHKSLEANVSNEDLSAYIIPPPPSSSPSTEAQNEVIARFMAAAEDMKRMFEKDLDPEVSQNSFRELQQFWSEIKSNDQRNNSGSSNSNFLLGLNQIETLNSTGDLGSHSGDSSGYDTLTSSLTSYSDTVVSDETDALLNSPSFPNSSDSTPTFEQTPTSISILHNGNNGVPVAPRLRTSCVDDITSPLSITSPSSTTSSDSSVILLDGASLDPSENSRKFSMNDFSPSNNACQTGSGSCDNLVWKEGQDMLSPGHSGIVRSVSWTSIADVDSSKSNAYEKTVVPTRQKPPIFPHNFHQVCFLLIV